MPLTVPSTIFPTEERFVNIVREATPGTIPAAFGSTMPLMQLEPEDKPLWLLDESLRGGMGDIYDFLQGPEYAEVTIPASPVYVDNIPHALYNVLGDYTSNAPLSGSLTTVSAAVTVGATSFTVASIGSIAANSWLVYYQAGATGPAEIVQVLSVAGSVVTLTTATPTRFPHAAGSSVGLTVVTAGTYQHAFSLLTSGFLATGNYQNFGQPVTHTFTDRTQVPSFGGNPGYSRQYADSCFQSVVLTGNAEKLLEWNGGFSSYVGAIPSSLATASVSGIHAMPDWQTTVQLATSGALAPVYNIAEWQLTLTRKLKVMFTNDGSQNPYVIGRGALSISGKLVFSPATDETALLYLLNNTQPQLQILTTNGLATTNPLYQAIQIDVLYCDFDTSKISASDVLFGYDVTFKSHHTANTRNSITATGWSGGYSACKVTVSNAVPIF